ncbi:MAG: hypothetical protein KBF28_15355 [Gemmatimonadales bacterium]|nr:hypothetical protein [Gemmatimonadales bacterium]
MNLKTWILPVAGFVAGVSFILACSDDAPSSADAAACDCPAAEPPLAGRIMAVAAETGLAPMGTGAPVADCPAGAMLLGGGCTRVGASSVVEGTLSTAGPFGGGSSAWICEWTSTSTEAQQVRATAYCLMPAQ